MPNEVSVHAQEYGFGGSFFEDEFFDTDDEEDDIEPPNDPEWDGTRLTLHTDYCFPGGGGQTALYGFLGDLLCRLEWEKSPSWIQGSPEPFSIPAITSKLPIV